MAFKKDFQSFNCLRIQAYGFKANFQHYYQALNIDKTRNTILRVKQTIESKELKTILDDEVERE